MERFSEALKRNGCAQPVINISKKPDPKCRVIFRVITVRIDRILLWWVNTR